MVRDLSNGIIIGDLEGRFCYLKPFCLTYSVCFLWYTWKRTWIVISSMFSKTKDVRRSKPVRHTVNVVSSLKLWRCYCRPLIGR